MISYRITDDEINWKKESNIDTAGTNGTASENRCWCENSDCGGDGETTAPRRVYQHFKKHYRRLRRASKNLSRKQKGSKNREKARIKVARIHAQITDSRKDHLHKLTTQLVRSRAKTIDKNR